MAYGHKTQSFMKNRGQQKCFDKALEEEGIYWEGGLKIFQKGGEPKKEGLFEKGE